MQAATSHTRHLKQRGLTGGLPSDPVTNFTNFSPTLPTRTPGTLPTGDLPPTTSPVITCSTGADCGANEYCALTSGTGPVSQPSCQPCWKACLSCNSPTDCPSAVATCRCNTNGPCAGPSQCGKGGFCSDSRRCKSCYSCIVGTEPLAGNCQANCGHPARSTFPARGLPFATSREKDTRFVVDGFFEVNQILTGATGVTNVAAFENMLRKLGVAYGKERQAQLVFSRADTNGDRTATTEEIVAALYARPALETFCDSDPLTIDAKAGQYIFPGCPCNAVSGTIDPTARAIAQKQTDRIPTTGQCQAGYRCSVSAFNQLRQFSLVQQDLPFQGLCVPCLLGEFCGAGTVERTLETIESCGNGATVAVQDGTGENTGTLELCNGYSLCPAGHYCPDPSHHAECTASNYCPVGSVIQSTCALNVTVQRNPFRMIQQPSQYMLTTLLTQKKPVGGNFCPARTETPFADCPAGSYCPTPGDQKECPKDHYCPKGSMEPLDCPFLRTCGQGAKAPGLSWGGMFALIILLSIFPLILYVYHQRIRHHQEKQRKTDSLLEFMTAMRFSSIGGRQADRGAPRDSDGGLAASTVSLGGHKKQRRCWCFCDACGAVREELDMYWERLQQGLLKLVYAASRAFYAVFFGVPFAFKALWSCLCCRKPHRYHPDHAAACHFSSNCPTCSLPLNLCSHSHPGPNQPLDPFLPTGAASDPSMEATPEELAAFVIQPKERIAVEWRRLTLRLPSGKKVLNSVSGMFEHGMLHAIMGPSGSGKSTFLATLCDKASYAKRTGDADLFVGKDRGTARKRQFEDVQYLTGFVPQDDIVHEELTVRENLLYSARLRLPNNISWTKKLDMVRHLVALLGLSHVQHSQVGSVERRGISGGQRKRVNIGMELAAKPSMLLLDEPTSGLDAAMSQDLLTLLRKLARAGMNIVTTIHQPRYSIFLMFDSVLLLGVGGHTVYLGHSGCALEYFERLGFPLPEGENPADFLLDVISGTVPRLRAAAGGNHTDRATVDTSFIPRDLFHLWNEVIDKGGLEKLPRSELFYGNTQILKESGGLVRVGSSWVRPIKCVARPRDLEGAFDKFNDIDIDRSGKLTIAELGHCWASLQGVLPPHELEAFMHSFKKFYEKDPDTGETVITREKFMLAVEERLFPSRSALQQQLVASQGGLLSQPSSATVEFVEKIRGHANEAAKSRTLTREAMAMTRRQARKDSKLAFGLMDSTTSLRKTPSFADNPSFASSSAPGVGGSSSLAIDEEAAQLPAMNGTGPVPVAGGAGGQVQTIPPGARHSDVAGVADAWHANGNGGPVKERAAGQAAGARRKDDGVLSRLWMMTKNGINRWWGGKVRGRRLPSEMEQCWLVVLRSASKWFNDMESRIMDLVTIAFVSLALGSVQGYSPIDAIPIKFVMALLGMSLLSTMASLRTFGSENVIFLQRESPGGLYTIAYWLGRMLWDCIDLLWRPAVYMGLYYSMATPNISRRWLYLVFLCVSWYSYGLGYLISVCMDRSVATLVGVAIPLIYGGVINGLDPPLSQLRTSSSPLKLFADLSYTRWGVEAMVIKEAAGVEQDKVLLTAGVLAKLGYCELEQKVGKGNSLQPGADSSPGVSKEGQAAANNSTLTLEDYQTILGVKNVTNPDDLARADPHGDVACEQAHGDNLNPSAKQLAQMYCYYKQPAQLQADCRPYFYQDLFWLFIIGLALRALTLVVIKYKVWRKKQK